MRARRAPMASLSWICRPRRRCGSGTFARREGEFGWRLTNTCLSWRLLTSYCSLSYVPLIAPATSDDRMKILCKIADSFIYVVSRMGVTGATGTLNAALPDLLDRVHKSSGNAPAAVGFGVSTKDHF